MPVVRPPSSPPARHSLPPSRRTHAPIARPLTSSLLKLYDYPHPHKPGRWISGYDKAHALRTARMCIAVAQRLGFSQERIRSYFIACLLHDLGRAGLDQKLFGAIWSWAKRQNIPTRPKEWRMAYPETPYGKETEAFLLRYRPALEKMGIHMDGWVREQVEMRLGFARRLRRRLRVVRPDLARLGITWSPWMEKVMLYYYYPEKLSQAPQWVHQLAEILVACEQLEAYSNRRRGQDYYTRSTECFREAFEFLDTLMGKGIVSQPVMDAIRTLVAEGTFDHLLRAARGGTLSSSELRYLRSLTPGGLACQS